MIYEQVLRGPYHQEDFRELKADPAASMLPSRYQPPLQPSIYLHQSQIRPENASSASAEFRTAVQTTNRTRAIAAEEKRRQAARIEASAPQRIAEKSAKLRRAKMQNPGGATGKIVRAIRNAGGWITSAELSRLCDVDSHHVSKLVKAYRREGVVIARRIEGSHQKLEWRWGLK